MSKLLLCFGDSLTYGYGVRPPNVWHQVIARKKRWMIINRGQNGDSLLGMRLRMEHDLLQTKKDACTFMAGTNDLLSGRVPAQVAADTESLFETIADNQPQSCLIIPPPAIGWMAERSWDATADYMQCNLGLMQMAESLSLRFPGKVVNLFSGFMDLDQKTREALYLDGIHLTEEGHQFFAETLLSDPAFVTI